MSDVCHHSKIDSTPNVRNYKDSQQCLMAPDTAILSTSDSLVNKVYKNVISQTPRRRTALESNMATKTSNH